MSNDQALSGSSAIQRAGYDFSGYIAFDEAQVTIEEAGTG
jgi:hypothetical protein